MADALRPRLDRLQELSKKLNSVSDDVGHIVQGVETYLTDILHLGVPASVLIETDHIPEECYYESKRLHYGRYGTKFRLYVSHIVDSQGEIEKDDATLWANCPRDLKLKAFNALPELLDTLIKSLEGTLEQVESSTETIQALVPPREHKKKGAAS